ncbi:hypothetical protein CQ10_30040 [Bradyrhizobium valentinum]|nr:hypothetical protein CQ10_30040 [Bradyrhizobium valentinum]
MSSLLLLPSLLRVLPKSAKVAVLTYDSAYCGEDLLGLENLEDRKRIVVGGIEGGVFWHNEMKRPPPPTDPADIDSDVTACVRRLRADHPTIGAILFECAGFPLAAPAVRKAEGLPVYDITHLCRLMLTTVR